MACIEFACEGVTGHICMPDHVVDLSPYGSRVWCEFSRALGVSFYRGRDSTEEIRTTTGGTLAVGIGWLSRSPFRRGSKA